MDECVSTGDHVLDEALSGGIPEGAAVLLTGGPGTGKTIAAMQFLQEGLRNDERCVFISTEQAVSDLRGTLDSFAFELDHPELTLTTVHASTGESVVDGETALVMRTLDGGTPIDDGHSVPFTPTYLRQYLEKLAPADRVVLDSASGLAALTGDEAQYRRTLLDVIRQFKREFEATSILTAQDYANQDDTVASRGSLASSLPLQFTADGVLRLWQDELEGEYHRYVHVTKMRGVDHDLRPYEMSIDEQGVRLSPLNRSPPASLSAKGRMPSGLPRLDDLLGGGIITGGVLTYLYSGDAHPRLFLTKVAVTAASDDESGRDIVVVPSPQMTYEQLGQYVRAVGDRSLDEYLETEQFTVLDILSGGSRAGGFLPEGMKSPAVLSPSPSELLEELRRIQYQTADPVVFIISCEALRMYSDGSTLSDIISVLSANVRGTADTAVFTAAAELLDGHPKTQLRSASDQILKQARRPNGMEYIRLEKGLGGQVGSSRVIEYYRDAPYIELA